MHARRQLVPHMCATAQTLLRLKAILGTVRRYAKAMVLNVSVRTDKRSVDHVDAPMVIWIR